jgi:hypothetical protein
MKGPVDIPKTMRPAHSAQLLQVSPRVQIVGIHELGLYFAILKRSKTFKLEMPPGTIEKNQSQPFFYASFFKTFKPLGFKARRIDNLNKMARSYMRPVLGHGSESCCN